jgi:predicted RNA binding protein YcfA (HicA-like mRNA interferase family)
LKLPRDLSGDQLTKLLRRFGYEVTRQTGSHMRVTSKRKGTEHSVTIPAHKELRIGTLAEILGDAARYLEMDRDELAQDLFNH